MLGLRFLASRGTCLALGWAVVAAPPAAAESHPIAVRASRFGVSPGLARGRPPAASPAASGPVQRPGPTPGMPTPTLTFDGLTDADDLAQFSLSILPPDTAGDVGPNHYVQMVNTLLRVYDKSGTPLTAPVPLTTLFTAGGVASPCVATSLIAPVVLYDQLADRWLLSASCYSSSANNHQLIVVSRTPDPTGAWYLYDYARPNGFAAHEVRLGAWSDAYYMADDEFDDTHASSFQGAAVYAFDRARLLAGDPGASCVYFAVDDADASVLLPVDLDGLTPPPAGSPGYFVDSIATEFFAPIDGLQIFAFHADFATPAASTLTARPESPLAVAAFDPRTPPGRNDIEQPPPATASSYLDAEIGAFGLLPRLAYRNFGDHESLVAAQTVNVSGVNPTTAANMLAGVRYYELRRTLPAGAFAVHEQATFAPADGVERWVGAAAMDGSGDLAVGFSASSATVFPSIRYAGRLAGDPAGGLPQGEAVMQTGGGAQTTSLGNWGSTSALSVDVSDDCSFWYANEYYATSSLVGWRTRIGRFSFPSCTPITPGTLGGTVVDLGTSAPIAGATVSTSSGYLRITDGAGAYAMAMHPGSYGVTAAAPGYESATATGVVIGAGGTTTRGFALRGLPSAVAGAPTAIAAEGCGPGNGAIDPSELVTVSLPVKNVGKGPSIALTGTLLVGGGVTEPGVSQSYGVVAVGATKARTFTFRAVRSCGGTVTATLRLRDGALDLGTVGYVLDVGVHSTAVYSTGDLSVAIPAGAAGPLLTPLPVPDGGMVTDVDVRVRIGHTFDGDLALDLLDPVGSPITLSLANFVVTGDDFGSGATACSGQPTVFDDEAATAFTAGTPPYAGSFRPLQPLSAFDGNPATGTWNLRIADTGAAPDRGTLYCFQLAMARTQCCVDPGGVLLRDGYESGNALAWAVVSP